LISLFLNDVALMQWHASVSESEGQTMETKSRLVRGSCLCGAVQVSVELEKSTFDACHCRICRKWAGGPALSIDAGKNLSFTGEENIAVYDSSTWAQRGFCKQCGTHLFYRLKNAPYTNLPLGLLDGLDQLKMQTQLFVDSKPTCYDFANATEMLTEADILAKFGPPPA
jgi:hypothetical protein